VNTPARAALATIVTVSLALAGLVSMPVAASAATPSARALTAAAAPAPDASISGTVTSAKTKKGLPNATVEAYAFDDDLGELADDASATATTAANGAYRLELPHGLYLVKFVAPTSSTAYVDEYWKNSNHIWDSEFIELEAGDALSRINGALEASAHITGTILPFAPALAAATPFSPADIAIDVCTVETYDDGWDSWTETECGFGKAIIDAAGKYTVSNLHAGTYTVHVTYSGTGNYRDEYYPNGKQPKDAKTFKVKAGATVAARNLVLDPGATITGTVTGAADAPLEGATVNAYSRADWGDMGYDEYEEVAARSATADAQGNYTITGLWDGSFALETPAFTTGDDTYAAEWFVGAYSSVRATPVLASIAAPVDRDIQLSLAASISGQVVDVAHAPVAGITVSAYRALSTTDNRSELAAEVTSDANGAYSFAALPAGDYFVKVSENIDDSEYFSTTYLESFYGAAAGESIHKASRVSLHEGDDTTLELPVVRGGAYSGTVLGGGEPIPGAFVSLLDPDGFYVSEVETNEIGEFEFTGLSAGAYTLEIDYWGDWDSDEEFDQPFSDANYQMLRVAAPPVTVDSATTELGDFDLKPSSTLSGKLTGSTGKALKGASLYAFAKTTDGFEAVDSADTDKKGNYTFSDLPTGDVYIYISAAGYPLQFLGGADDVSFAAPLRIPADGSVQSRDIQLFKGSSISGTVRNAVTGRAIPNTLVYAAKHGTDAAISPQLRDLAATGKKGTYTIPGLPSGSYDVNAASVTLDDDVSPYSAQTKQLYLANSAAKVNFSLAPRTTITGVVTSSLGVPLEGITVFAVKTEYDPESELPLYFVTETDETGKYSFVVDTGDYILDLSDDSNAAAETFSGGVADPEDATIISATGKKITANVTMLSFPGRLTASFVGQFDENLDGWVTLERTPVGGGEPWTFVVFGEDFMGDALDIPNLREGDYTISVGAHDSYGYLVGYTGTFSITADEPVVDLGAIDLGENIGMPDESIPGNTGVLPTIANLEPTVGDELTINSGEWDDEIVDFDYQWFRGDKAILGATQSTYFVAPGDAGKKLSVRVIPRTNEDIIYESYLTTEPTASVAKAAAANAWVEPTITGLARVGQPLTLTEGEWDLENLNFAYSWVRTTGETTKIVSTKATYKPVVADIVGSTLSATITVTKAGFESTSRTVAVGDIQPATALKQTKKSVVTLMGDSYQVTPGTWSPKGAVVTYEWFTADADGETSENVGASYLNDPSKSHLALTVRVTATKPGYATTTVEYLVHPARVLEWVSEPQDNGTNQVGGVLSINVNSLATEPEATAYTFQWRVDNKVVKGATKSVYSPTKAGGDVTVHIVATRAKFGPSEHLVVPFGVTTTGGAFEGDFSVSGNPAIAFELTADLSFVSPKPTSATYQWYRSVSGGVPVKIAKATKSIYVPTEIDYDAELVVVATLKRPGYTTTVLTATSAPIDARSPTGMPSIAKSARVGTAITAVRGEWSVASATFSYQWTINGTDIIGATAKSYTPRPEDIDEELAVIVTGTVRGVAPGSWTSNAVTVEAGAAPTASKAPAVTVGGKSVTTTTLGKTLVANSGTWRATGIEVSYQWQLNDGDAWANIDGATSKTLVLDADNGGVFDHGWKYRVQVIATKAGHATSTPVFSKAVTLK